MPRNPRRSTAIVVGIVVVLALVAVVAYLAGRFDHAATPPRHTASPSSVPAHGTRSPSPVDPRPALSRGKATAGEGGRTVGPDGLPLGYDRSRNGAVTAATNYLMWLDSIRITDKATADAMATAAASDSVTRAALVRSADETRSGMENLTADQLQPARGAYAVAHYSGNEAIVYIWAPEVTTDKGGTTNHLWAIDAVRVVWANGDWKLDHELITRTGGAAVDPADPAGNPGPVEKRSILSRIPADPGEITDSADQTWFEYANAAR